MDNEENASDDTVVAGVQLPHWTNYYAHQMYDEMILENLVRKDTSLKIMAREYLKKNDGPGIDLGWNW